MPRFMPEWLGVRNRHDADNRNAVDNLARQHNGTGAVFPPLFLAAASSILDNAPLPHGYKTRNKELASSTSSRGSAERSFALKCSSR